MRSRLSGRVFYGLIIGGVCAGCLLASIGARSYLHHRKDMPDGRRIWSDVAADFLVPVAAMMGGTFGGLAGVAGAAALDRATRARSNPRT